MRGSRASSVGLQRLGSQTPCRRGYAQFQNAAELPNPTRLRSVGPAAISPGGWADLFSRRCVSARMFLRREAAKHAAKDGANRFPAVRFVGLVRHGFHDGANNGREVVKVCQEYGNVGRGYGN